MSKRIKVINNELIEISDYRCSASLYPEVPPTLQNVKNQIEHCEDWCVFKETINPFVLYSNFYELQQRIDKAVEYIDSKTVFSIKGLDLNICDEELDKLLNILKGDDTNES